MILREMQYVLCEVGTEFLNIVVKFLLERVEATWNLTIFLVYFPKAALDCAFEKSSRLYLVEL
jgi:hypothetical protein